ncbi:hypothetical protein ABE169_16730 [Bacillus subtilis]
MKILVIKTNKHLKNETREAMRVEVKRAIETGVMVLDGGLELETVEVDDFKIVDEPHSEEKSFSPVDVVTDAITYISSKYGVDVAIPEKDLSSLTVQQIKEPPLLQIELDNLRSVPRVFYKGEEIKNKVRVDFSYLTGDEYGSKPIYIDIVSCREDGTVKGISHNQGAIGIDERRLSTGDEQYGSSL